MAQSDPDAVTAPFLPWKSLRSFVAGFHGGVIPPQIDSSILRKKSGSDAAALRTAFKFFGLTAGVNGDVTAKFKQLVEAVDTDQWPAAVRDVVLASYADVTNSVDLIGGTQKQLEDAFRDKAGVSGGTLPKAVRFYLTAMKEAGVKGSPFFTSVRGNDSEDGDGSDENGNRHPATPRQKRPRKSSKNGAAERSIIGAPPSGVRMYQPIPEREFKFWVPNDLTEDEWKFGVKYVQDVRKLAKKEPKTDSE